MTLGRSVIKINYSLVKIKNITSLVKRPSVERPKDTSQLG